MAERLALDAASRDRLLSLCSALGSLGCLRSSLSIVATLAGILLLHAVAPAWVPHFSDDHYTDYLKVGLFFMAGVAAFALRERLIVRARYAVPLVVIAAALQETPVAEYALYLALFYCVLAAAVEHAAASFAARRLLLRVYIYGYPIQQTVQHFLPGLTSYPSNLICLPVAGLAGYLSWTFVEHPILRRAHRLADSAQTWAGRRFVARPPLASPRQPGQGTHGGHR